MTEAAVLTRARAGDEEAFRSLVEPYGRELQLHCYRILGSLQDAEDLLQDTLVAILRRSRAVVAESPRAYLSQAVFNMWVTHRRQQARRIGDRLGELAPRAMRFAPGRIPEPGAPLEPERPAKPLVEPDPEVRKVAATLASEIGDAELRGLV